MISTAVAALPRKHENLKFVVMPFTLSLVNGKLSNFEVKNSNGYVIADFVKQSAGSPHSCFGPVKITDGLAQTVLSIPSAFIQIEQGPDEGPWKTISSLIITGMSDAGQFYVARSTGTDPNDETSIIVEFGITDQFGLRGLSELSAWAMSK